MTYETYIEFALALVLVLALMAILAIILKKVNHAHSGLIGRDNRLKIVEQRMIDTKHKMVLIRCDDKEHLVILSQNGETVVKNDIKPPLKKNAKNKKDIPVESS